MMSIVIALIHFVVYFLEKYFRFYGRGGWLQIFTKKDPYLW